VSVACIGPAGEQLVYGASVRAESSYAPQDDFDIAPRLLEKLRSGPAAGIGLTLDELTAIRSQYYACLGWSAATGAPGRAVLERLGLDDLRIGRVEGRGGARIRPPPGSRRPRPAPAPRGGRIPLREERMALTADVVIIGGEVTGTSIAFRLAARGMRDVSAPRWRTRFLG
jgi:hypothetical protein